MTCMGSVPVQWKDNIDSAAVASSRRPADEAYSSLERSWVTPQPDVIVTAVWHYLAGVEKWGSDLQRNSGWC